MAGCTDNVIGIVFDKFKKDILKQKEYAVQTIDGQMVHVSFSKTAESAGSLDGWHPNEPSLFSKTIRDKVVIMLNLIEE